jgi:hypothetical protein
LFVVFFPDNVVDGRRVFFVLRNPETLRVGRRGRRASTLLVGPDALLRRVGERPAAPGPG